ncbi:MAG TPA: hypothetical protein VN457_03235, partial [Chlamydiales bacterium]|nr:hypothetical protein [Chlamydiales bacterium]
MKKLFTILLFLLFPLFLAAAQSVLPPSQGCPVWIDFQRVLAAPKENDTDCSLPVRYSDHAFLANYHLNCKTHHVERIELIDAKTKKIQEVATFGWSQDRLDELSVADESGGIHLCHKITWLPDGSFSALQTSSTGSVSERYSAYDSYARVIELRERQVNGSETQEKFKYDDAGKVLRQEVALRQQGAPHPLFSQVTFRKNDGTFRKEMRAYQETKDKEAKITSESIYEWGISDSDRLQFFRTVSKNNHAKETRYEYDSNGKLQRKIKPDGTQLNYEYNIKNQLHRLVASDKTVDYTLLYDDAGRICEVFDAVTDALLQRTFSPSGQLLQEEINGAVSQFEYSQKGKLCKIVFPDKSKVEFSEDAILRYSKDGALIYTAPSKIPNFAAPSIKPCKTQDGSLEFIFSDTQGSYKQTISYDRFRQIAQETGPFSHTFSFDSLYHLVEKDGVSVDRNEFGNVVSQPVLGGKVECEYDQMGNLISKKKGRQLFEFSYDALD